MGTPLSAIVPARSRPNPFLRGGKSHASFSSPPPRSGARALALLAAAAPAADLDKYLPDDAQIVAVVNVKQITAWTPFQKQIQDQIQQLLKTDEAQRVLKDTGFDPVRDIDRVVVVAAADSYKTVNPPQFAPPPVVKPVPVGVPAPAPGVGPPPGGAAPPPGVVAPPPPPPAGSFSTSAGSPFGFVSFILVQGKFDADKLEAKAQQALKDHPDVVKKPRMVGGIELWQIATGPSDHIYLAMLDKNTLMATGLESQALEALDKANGKKKTELKDKQVRDALAKTDPKAALQVAASGDLVTSVSMKSDGKGGFTTTTKTLHDDGFEGYHGSVGLGDADLHYTFTLTAKDADKAKETAKNMSDGVDKALADAKAHPERMPKELLPALDAFKTVKITASGDTISVEGSATAEEIEAAVKAFFTLTSSSPKPSQPPGVRPPEDVRKPDAQQPATPPPPKKDK